jgi:hypothetical protein
VLLVRLGLEHEFDDLNRSLGAGQVSRSRQVMLLCADQGSIVETQFDGLHVTCVNG